MLTDAKFNIYLRTEKVWSSFLPIVIRCAKMKSLLCN